MATSLQTGQGTGGRCKAFLQAIANGGPAPIGVEELFEVQSWLLQAVRA